MAEAARGLEDADQFHAVRAPETDVGSRAVVAVLEGSHLLSSAEEQSERAPLTRAFSPSERVREAEAAATFLRDMGGDYAPRRRRSIIGQGVQAGQFALHKVRRNALSA